MPRKPIAAAITILIAAALSPTANARTFTVYSCKTPTGTWTGMEGWTSAASAPVQGKDPGSTNSCPAGNSNLVLQFGDTQLPVESGRFLRWSFSAPTGTKIESIVIPRTFLLAWPIVSGQYGRPYVYDAWHDSDVAENQLEFYFPPFNGDTEGVDFDPVLTSTSQSWDSFSLRLRCWELMGDHDCAPFRADLTIPRTTIGLADDTAPTAAVTGGALAGGDVVRGDAGLAFHASDVGGGVYRAVLAVDGDEVSREVVDPNGGRCADVEPGNDDAYEFGVPQPCPLDADGTVQIDTAALQDGAHAVTLTVEDAAGNADVAFSGTVTTHNAPIATTAPAISGTARVGAALATGNGQWDGAPTGFGYRWLRCDADGSDCAGIPGAAGAAYTATSADAYHRLRAEVTAENHSGAATARSAPSAVVADAAGRTSPPASGGATGGGSDAGGIANPLANLPGHVANGAPASARAHLEIAFRLPGGRSATRIRSPRNRAWRIVGRLLDAANRPIANARIGTATRVAGRAWTAGPGTLRSDADGRVAFTLRPGPSRTVKLTYFPFSDSRGYVSSNVLTEDVLAPLAIRADRHRVTGARVVRLSGRVGGGLIPRGGLLVTLQGYQSGFGWRTFRTVHTTSTGRWSTRYRFRLAHGRFGFRAVVPRQGRYPFITSRSKAVFVSVG